ncbi:MAG: uracil-DNA glycosylase [Roseibium album]|uniref:uracil-DNA glycosylase n=1 Tax=Roseibium album TaxID=311410 RepID=UPI0032ED1CF1
MQNPQQDLRKIESLLEFYVDAGIDCFLGDEAVDWAEQTLRQAAERRRAQVAVSEPKDAHSIGSSASQPARIDTGRLPKSPAQPQTSITPQAPTASQTPVNLSQGTAAGQPAVIPDQQIVASARDLAASAETLDDLRTCLEAFDGCNLKLTAKRLVFADGSPDARLMFVGEAPGRDEDLQGKPFVGRSGQLLDRMLTAIGLDRSSAYIANVVPWRPPGNRTPTPQETEICKPFIKRQIELVNPDVLVFLGAASAKNLLGVQDGIRKMRGRWMSYPVTGRQIAAIATYHPAYLLRSPLEKRLSWRDFLSIRAKLTES